MAATRGASARCLRGAEALCSVPARLGGLGSLRGAASFRAGEPESESEPCGRTGHCPARPGPPVVTVSLGVPARRSPEPPAAQMHVWQGGPLESSVVGVLGHELEKSKGAVGLGGWWGYVCKDGPLGPGCLGLPSVLLCHHRRLLKRDGLEVRGRDRKEVEAAGEGPVIPPYHHACHHTGTGES